MRAIYCLFLILLVAGHFSENACAQFRWGHLDHFEERKSAFLSTAALRNHLIRFCIENTASEKFNNQSLAVETRLAIELWLKASPTFLEDTKIEQSSCEQGNHHLQIFIGNKLSPTSSAYVDFVKNHGHLISRITIDTKYREKHLGIIYSTVDFANFFRDDSEMAKFAKLADHNHWNHRDAAKHLGVPEGQVYDSTYHELIHEIGHTFGLCDTYGAGNCDPAFTTAVQPASSVMKTANLFYLTSDDIVGLNKIYDRIR